MRKPFGPRRPTSAWKPPTGPGSTPKERKTEDSQSPSSRRKYKPVDNRLATIGWDLTTKNTIVEHRIKELTLGSLTILLHSSRLWPEAVSTMMWPFYFKAACQKYNNMEIYEERKTPDQKFSGVEFQIFLTDYHTWGFLFFVLEAPPQGNRQGYSNGNQWRGPKSMLDTSNYTQGQGTYY